MTGMKLMY